MAPRRTRQELSITLEGVFDVPAAKRAERLLARAGQGDVVRVDVTRVREFDDLGVALLGQAIKAAAGVDVAVHGLRLHQARLLRYFGVEARRLERVAATR